jgi:hypothetical protein
MMHIVHNLSRFLSSLILLCSCSVTAIVLQELPHASENSWLSVANKAVRRSADYSTLNLRNSETFTWGGKSIVMFIAVPGLLSAPPASQTHHAVLANLTVYMPDSQENIISLQRFKSLLRSVECTQEAIDFRFKDDTALQYAKATWDWVNVAENHTFVLVADTRDCGWNDHRVPFIVSNLHFNEQEIAAHLTAKASTWRDATHTYTLQVGNLAYPLTKVKRQVGDINVNREFSIPFVYKLPIPAFEFVAPLFDYQAAVKVDCEDCGTRGSFEIGLHLESQLGIPLRAQASLKPRGVEARIAPRLTLAGNLTSTPFKLMERTWPAIALQGITVPGGILDIAPELIFSGGMDIGPFTGSGSISGGTIMALDDSEHATIDLLGASPYTQSSWTPNLRPRNVILDMKVAVETKMTLKAKLHMNTKALGSEYDLGVSIITTASAKTQPIACKSLIVIDVDVHFANMISAFGGPACPDDKELNGLAVNVITEYGVSLSAEAVNMTSKDKTPTEYTLNVGYGSSFTRFGANSNSYRTGF